MFYTLIHLTCLMLLGAMFYGYRTTRDPLHPIIFLAPLCIYSYIYKPIVYDYFGALDVYFDHSGLLYVQVVNMLGLAAFVVGLLWHSREVSVVGRSAQQSWGKFQSLLTPAVRQRAIDAAYVFGAISLSAFWLMIYSGGGLSVVYGQAKGGVSAASGYLGEAPMLSLPAIGLLYFAWAGKRFSFGKIALLLLFASPMIIHGLLGARRGPTFMIFAGLMAGGYAVSQRRPRLSIVFGGVVLLGLLVLILFNYRSQIFLGNEALVGAGEYPDDSQQAVIDSGEDWIHSGGTIITSNRTGVHFWGSRVLFNTFLRPVPRQIWPNKYVDSGFGWLDDQSDVLGMTDNEWIQSVGWVPVRGAAAGFVADLYLEFGWFGLLACWLLGWTYSWLWRGMVLRGGIWAILYVYAASLSIYVPTQNVTDAWVYRMLIFTVPTIIAWRMLIQPLLKELGNDRPAPYPLNRKSSRPALPVPGVESFHAP